MDGRGPGKRSCGRNAAPEGTEGHLFRPQVGGKCVASVWDGPGTSPGYHRKRRRGDMEMDMRGHGDGHEENSPRRQSWTPGRGGRHRRHGNHDRLRQ